MHLLARLRSKSKGKARLWARGGATSISSVRVSVGCMYATAIILSARHKSDIIRALLKKHVHGIIFYGLNRLF